MKFLAWISGPKDQEVDRPVEKFDQRLRFHCVGRRDSMQGHHPDRVDAVLRADEERQGEPEFHVA